MKRCGLAFAVLIAATGAPPVGQDTMKSRLGTKASDEQRVDDCKVPEEKRSDRLRPGCDDGTPPASGN